MSHRLLISPKVAGSQTATELKRFTNNMYAMAFYQYHTEDATDRDDPVGAVLDVVSCRSTTQI